MSRLNFHHWTRRQFLQTGLATLGLTSAVVTLPKLARSQTNPSLVKIPPIPQDLPTYGNAISPMAILRDFDYGTVKQENGQKAIIPPCIR